MNSLFNRFGNNNAYNNNNNNILAQYAQLKRNPAAILDVLLQRGKITQYQYNELQKYKNNPEAIGRYLINSGNGNEIRQAEQTVNQINKNN